MTSNLKISQSSPLNLSATSILPSGKSFRSHKQRKGSVPATELSLTSQRSLAWQIAPNLLQSFKYAWTGICYAFETQRNFRIHTMMTIVAISLGLILKVNGTGMAIVSLTCALVMVLELLNTALESVVDLTVGQSYHELAKIAKDCAAGAVMIGAMASLLVASFIILPSLVPLIATL